MSEERPNVVQEHPEFPFGETLARERIERWEESFEGRPEPDLRAGELLRDFLEFVERYAFLERIVQGEIRYELPVHPRFLEQRERSDEPLEQQAAELAEAEAELLGQPDVPALGLLDELEEIGIKVVTTTDPGEDELLGAFFFEGETGPAFFVGTDRDDPRTAFVLAHLLGHYIADHDPYCNRVCRWRSGSLENLDESPVEIRADLFARALLVPEEPLRRYLDQLGAAVSAGETEARRSWEILATLFGVPDSVLADRMADLGFELLAAQLRSADRRAGLSAEREKLSPDGSPSLGGGRFALPLRYLNLALACYHERILEADVLGQFLSMGPEELQVVLDWSQVGRRPESAEDGDPDGADPDGDGDPEDASDGGDLGWMSRGVDSTGELRGDDRTIH